MKTIKKMVLTVFSVSIFFGCNDNPEVDYKTMTNDEINGYFIVRRVPWQRDNQENRASELVVFSIRTGEVVFYDLHNLLGLHHAFDNNYHPIRYRGETISRKFFSPCRIFIGFRVFGTDALGREFSRSTNRWKTVVLNLQTGEIQTILLPEHAEPISMPCGATLLYLDLSRERPEGIITYNLWNITTETSRVIYTMRDIETPRLHPHNAVALYDAQHRVLVFLNQYKRDGTVYFYFEDTGELEISRINTDFRMSMHDGNVILGARENNNFSPTRIWYSFNFETREYTELPFSASEVYPIGENLYFFRQFFRLPRFSFKIMPWFRIGIYDAKKGQVVARWFDSRISYDPFDPHFVPILNISEQYVIRRERISVTEKQ